MKKNKKKSNKKIERLQTFNGIGISPEARVLSFFAHATDISPDMAPSVFYQQDTDIPPEKIAAFWKKIASYPGGYGAIQRKIDGAASTIPIIPS